MSDVGHTRVDRVYPVLSPYSYLPGYACSSRVYSAGCSYIVPVSLAGAYHTGTIIEDHWCSIRIYFQVYHHNKHIIPWPGRQALHSLPPSIIALPSLNKEVPQTALMALGAAVLLLMMMPYWILAGTPLVRDTRHETISTRR